MDFQSAKMTEKERLEKNARLDHLIKEGSYGWEDGEAVARLSVLTDLAVELGRKDGVDFAVAWHEVLDKKGICGELAILLDYSRSIAIAGGRYETQWQWEQPTLAREIYYLRRAISRPEFEKIPDAVKCMCLNNLGNRLLVAGRVVEALDYWRRVLEVRPNFGMSLCNRARTLVSYAEGFEDKEQKALLFWKAHEEASAALAPTAMYTDLRDKATLDDVKELKQWIESAMDVKGITALDPLVAEDTSATEEEREYRRWCRDNYLYLTPVNDLGRYTVANYDGLPLPGHVVPVDTPYMFASFFEQMKQEYVSARWFFYEGLTRKTPHFSDRDVFLEATEPKPSLSLAAEEVKAAYRIAYSLFDKIGFFINSYMKLGIPEKRVTFRTLWRDDKNLIRSQFDVSDSPGNWAFCALYWLAKDFFEKEHDEVAEPQARGLSDIRNHVEHKYLRVTVEKSPVAPPDDLALMVSREQFEGKALHLLRVARSALIYLAIGVGFEERRREPGLVGMPIENLPSRPYLDDVEKV
jgi:hypothetical protein